MFAVTGAVTPAVSVKTDGIETAEMLIEAGIAQPAAYFHRSWVALPLDSPEDEMRHRITASYQIIYKALPKKIRVELDLR
ncbi:MmcQ/YjbR family DNA-binding protein [Paracoccus sp. (in: a-proteobacteria)]|uniref:MmcQ/YjbR family DNA-binding protein n=1 Tax=Paracoccus sp. TaxID=267 RepID=UPI003A8C0737